MASKLDVDEIAAKNGTSPVTLTKQSPSKFRVHHSGDTPTTNESFNMSSLTENGVGDYTYTFTNNFNTVHFSTVATSTEDGTIGYVTMYYARGYTRSASNVRLQGIDQGSNYEDGAYTSAVAHGDLA